MSDKEWANESLRMALQNIQDAATKPLHVEIERLTRELAEARTMILNYQLEGRDGSGIDRLRRELAEARRDNGILADSVRSTSEALAQALSRLAEARRLIEARDAQLDAAMGEPKEGEK
jgi:uncharacterized membrane protein YccC